MVFLEQVWAIARNTFLECIRQPVTLVVVIAASLLVILSNPFSAFTMEDDQRMYVDIGLSTIFIAGTVLSAFLATSVIDREIGNRTVLTVVSKPVARATFVLGKYIGLAIALVATVSVATLVFSIVEVHGVIQTAATPVRWPAVGFGAGAVVLATGAAAWANFFYGKSFPATLILAAIPLLAVAYVLSMVFDPDWAAVPISEEFRPEVWVAAGLMAVGLLILAAISVAASTRLGQVPTILVTIGFLLAGLLSDWFVGRRIASFEKARSLGPSADGLLDLALAFHLAGDAGGELTACEQATVLAPESAAAWSRLAHALARGDRVGDAVAAAERALELEPEDEDVVLLLEGLREREARVLPAA